MSKGQHRTSEPTPAQQAAARETGNRAAAVVAGARMGHAAAHARQLLGETPPSATN